MFHLWGSVQGYIISRRDLLIPQDIREIRGSFFTPQIWVEKSQNYIAEVLGENWQDEYYIWDCCAGTGNLINGLTNYRNVWASTIEQPDVDVMKDRITNGWGMFENHVFQMDFLNDDFSRCPEELQEILNDEKKRRKLVIYINPPYGEAGNKRQLLNKGSNKTDLSKNKTAERYTLNLGKAKNEMFAQFFTRIYKEISNCILGTFSSLTFFSGQNFETFRRNFNFELKKAFMVPAKTFDNVQGEFPIGFFVWDLGKQRNLKTATVDVFDGKGIPLTKKTFSFFTENDLLINDWIKKYRIKEGNPIGFIMYDSADFQANDKVVVISKKFKGHHHYDGLYAENLLPFCVYFSVKKVIEHTWIVHNDQFLTPNDIWVKDSEFIYNCLVYALFNDKNQISCYELVNHWIPFTEQQVGCKKAFKSDFMSAYLDGKIEIEDKDSILSNKKIKVEKAVLSQEAQTVYDSGLELWKYYFSSMKDAATPDASLYDIRKHFQGVDIKGKMNIGSGDGQYNKLIDDLRSKMKKLGEKIEPKVYEYGFLVK